MNRIKEVRQSKGIKQIDLAEKLNITQATLSNWERGVHDPDSNSLKFLSDFFQVTTDYLLGKSNIANPKAEFPPNFSYSFFNGYKELNDDNRALLHDLMEKMRLSQKVKETAQD